MEFSSIWYFSFCSIISLVFLIPGLHALDKATLPIPDGVMFQFKILLSFSMCTWSSYAFLFRPPLEQAGLNEGHKFQQFYQHLFLGMSPAFSLFKILAGKLNHSSWLVVIAVLGSVEFIFTFCVTSLLVAVRFYDSKAIGSFLTGFFGPLIIYPYHTFCWMVFSNLYFLVGFTQFFLGKESIFIVFVCHWHFSLSCVYCLSLYQTLCPWLKNLLATSDFMAHVYRKRKAIEAIVGLSGILVAQYFTRENSAALVVALLCFAVSWLANLAMNQPSTDMGIFNFLISASLECALNVFGFHLYTWFIFGLGLLLIILRWNIDSISLQHHGMQEIVLRDWKHLEQLHVSFMHAFVTGPACVFCPDIVMRYFSKLGTS